MRLEIADDTADMNDSHEVFDPLGVGPADPRRLVMNGLSDADFSVGAELVPIDSLVLADSPRLAGEDPEHVRRLTEAEAMLPPILVHRMTMRVIDGRHRLQAAIARGEDKVRVQFFEGPESHVFALAVGANIRHGLPLSLADREAAAARLIASHPFWSDRAIAATSGLAAGTVRAIRRREHSSSSEERLGRDGRVRPLNAARGRRIARDLIAQRPAASLREIAREAGISPATVRDVRLRMERGDDAIPLGRLGSRPARPGFETAPDMRLVTDRPRSTPTGDLDAILNGLRRDPSLRLTESGRTFLRWFVPRVVGPRGWDDLAAHIPSHCKYTVANLARHCASAWEQFAELMEEQAQSVS
jgi:ParB-like nuclease family protein